MLLHVLYAKHPSMFTAVPPQSAQLAAVASESPRFAEPESAADHPTMA